jgi:hypothetical protein
VRSRTGSSRRTAGPRILLRGLLAMRRLDAFEHAVVLRLQALEFPDEPTPPFAHRPEGPARHTDVDVGVLRLGNRERVYRIQL